MAFIDRLGGLLGPAGLSPEDQRRLGQLSLLNAGLAILSGRGPQAIGQGLLYGAQFGAGAGQQMLADARQRDAEERARQLREQLSGAGSPLPEPIRLLAGLDPEAAMKVGQYLAQQKLAETQIDKLNNPTTPDITEYQFAKQNGFTGTFEDWQKLRLSASGDVLPASVREWQFFSALPPEQQQRYLQMKRATDRIVDIGGVPTIVQTGVQPTTRPLSTLEKEVGAEGAKERAKTEAREQAKADVQALEDLPRARQQAQEMLRLLDQIEKHPGLPGAVGARAGLEYLPGTKEADFVALHDQVTGRLFMQAFETLKGGGQITEKEGEKATAAISRLQNRWQSEAAYKQAIQEIRDVVRAGLERAEQRARVAGYGDRIRATAGAQDDIDALMQKYGAR